MLSKLTLTIFLFLSCRKIITAAACVYAEKNRHGVVLRRMFNACLSDRDEPSREKQEHTLFKTCGIDKIIKFG